MNIDEILERFKTDIIYAPVHRMNITTDKYQDYIESLKETAKDRIIELMEGLKPHYRNNHLPEDAEFNKAIKIMEENIAELKEDKKNDSDLAEEIVRDSFCGNCKGSRCGSPCYVENVCDGFKDEVKKLLKEFEE